MLHHNEKSHSPSLAMMSLKPESKKNFYLKLLLCPLLLTSCQYFPTSHNDTTKPVPVSYNNKVESHHFLIDVDQNLMGNLASIRTRQGDTLSDIARHFGLGYNDIVNANPQLDPWMPEPDTQVLLPLVFIMPDALRQGIVLNLANMRLFHFLPQQPNRVKTYPVGIGRDGWNTPLGLTRIISKTRNPIWNVPISIQREHAQKGDVLPNSIPAGPDNPLGEYAMRLAKQSYLIHGTNKPYGIGMQISHGCLNLYPEDIKQLFQDTPVGTQVMIVNQPYLLAWYHEMLFLEAHKPLANSKKLKLSLLTRIRQLATAHRVAVDWTKVEQVLQIANGIPTPVLMGSLTLQELSANALPLPHPDYFYGQPLPKAITEQDWSITLAGLLDDKTARKLVAVLNHQGPIIPAMAVPQQGLLQVMAGPFASRQKAVKALNRLKRDFNLTGRINSPQPYQAPIYSPPNLTLSPDLNELPILDN
jgi:L,D-transpeptidase ErfK/SrfK